MSTLAQQENAKKAVAYLVSEGYEPAPAPGCVRYYSEAAETFVAIRFPEGRAAGPAGDLVVLSISRGHRRPRVEALTGDPVYSLRTNLR